MLPREPLDDERGRIEEVDAHLVLTTGLGIDDVVLRTRSDEQIELTHLPLRAAISASGGRIDEADLPAVSSSIAFPHASTRSVAS